MSHTIRELPFTNKIVDNHPIRGDVSDLSSGKCYLHPSDWYDRLVRVADKYGWTVGDRPQWSLDMETSHRYYIPLFRGDEQMGAVWVVAYRQPWFDYEMICGIC
jgi:hypothetical protein